MDKIQLLTNSSNLEKLRYSPELVDIMMNHHNTNMMINIFNIYHGIEYSIKTNYWYKDLYNN